jgi:urea transporter
VKLGLAQGAAGSTYTVIDFTNISNVTCGLYGYPGVSLGGGHPVTQIGLAAAESPATPRQLVTLAPGVVSNALLQIVHAQNFPPSKCGPVTATWLVIYPPNQTTPVYLKYSSLTCSKHVPILTISVVQPGSGG